MGYHGQWNSTDQVAQRAIGAGLIDRFGALDSSDGGHTSRYSALGDWQRGSRNGDASTRVPPYGMGYDLPREHLREARLHEPEQALQYGQR